MTMKPKKHFKLLVRKILKREKGIDRLGRPVIICHTLWEEVPEVNLGSVRKPNRDIVEFIFEPIRETQ
jgi:hypothetical protein